MTFDFSNVNIDSQYTAIGENSNTLNTFCEYLGGISFNLNNDKEKVYLIYKWVAENIEYDYENYKNNQPVEYEPAQVLTNKKTVCSGYARLFTKLLTCLNYPEEKIKNIIRHSKGLGYDIEKEITDDNSDHEWNAVKIEDNWCLIDATWGAGSIVNDAFQKSYTEYYLCTPPTQFVRSHLPKKTEEEFQFLKNPIDIPSFKNLAPTTTKFFEYGFVSITNDQAIQNICGEGKIILKYKTNNRPILFLKIKKDSTEYNWVMEEKITNGYDIIFSINEIGSYNLEINANIDKGNSYTRIVDIKLDCNTAPSIKKIYPEFTSDFNKDDDIKLISPIDNDLIQGNKYDFKIQSSNYEELYLIVDKEFFKMDKDGALFTENDVIIHGDSAKISYCNLNENQYYPLVIYSTSGTTVEFPQTSTTPFKKRLESPLKNTLTIGQEYTFQVKCDENYEIIIHYNGKIATTLDKNNNIYTKTITIENGSNGQLMIMYKENGKYSSMYFNISN